MSSYQMQSSDWRRRVRIMPLPELDGPGTANKMADLCEFSPASAIELLPNKRIASLSEDGLLILQQRLVFTQTRVLLSLDRLHEQMAPTFVELELQEEWVEEALSVSTDALEVALKAAEADYQAWLDEGNQARRESLKNPREHSRLRREARSELLKRYSSSESD
ncbi:hypothetical protein ACWGHA_23065 [Streptomyces xanthophaeus]